MTIKRFTVSLEESDYERLKALAEGNKPRLSLQYLVQYAIQALLEDVDASKSGPRIGLPIRTKDSNDRKE